MVFRAAALSDWKWRVLLSRDPKVPSLSTNGTFWRKLFLFAVRLPAWLLIPTAGVILEPNAGALFCFLCFLPRPLVKNKPVVRDETPVCGKGFFTPCHPLEMEYKEWNDQTFKESKAMCLTLSSSKVSSRVLWSLVLAVGPTYLPIIHGLFPAS